MRVAVVGSHATGKTSLIAELARRLTSVTTLDEPYYLLEDEGQAFTTPPTSDEFERMLARSIALFEGRLTGTVVFDRSPADYLAYLVASGRERVSPDLVVQVAAALTSLDLLVLVPIERPDRIVAVEAPRLRRRVDAILREMFSEDEWGFRVPVLVVRGSLEERADQVEARLHEG